MARDKGINSYSANFEPQVAGPLDARQKVDTVAELLLTSTWLANDGGDYSYVGMLVTVNNDPDINKNGIYRLKASDYSLAENWEQNITSVTAVGDVDGGSFV